MIINRIFDVFGPQGPVPNGLNWNYTSDLWDSNFFVTHDFIEKFNKKYVQVSVYDCNLNLPSDYIKNMPISDLYYNEEENLINNNDSYYFYTIHPFGNLQISTGTDFSFHENKHAFDFISKKAKKYSNTKNFYFIFDYSSEGDIRENLFESTHNACEKNDIDPSKVIIITSSLNTTDIYNSYLKDNPKENRFFTAFYPWAVLGKSKDTHSILYEKNVIEFNGNSNINSLMDEDEITKLKNRESKALSLNRRLAPHRIILISYLLQSNLFDDCKISFDKKMLYSEDAGVDLAMTNDPHHPPYISNDSDRQLILKGFRKMLKKEKSEIDYSDISGVWGFGFESSEIYKNTYFSIVTETLFYEYGVYMSEKIFKPFAHLHPFVLIGKPGILKYLKSLGFKTFSDFWDESYDDIQNDSERMMKCLEVIKSLVEKSNEEWDEMYLQLKDILIHNRKNLLSYNEKKVSDIYSNNLINLISDEPNKENYNLL